MVVAGECNHSAWGGGCAGCDGMEVVVVSSVEGAGMRRWKN